MNSKICETDCELSAKKRENPEMTDESMLLKSAFKELTGKVCAKTIESNAVIKVYKKMDKEYLAMTSESDAEINVYKKVDSECSAMTGESLREVSESLREVSENLRVPIGVYKMRHLTLRNRSANRREQSEIFRVQR